MLSGMLRVPQGRAPWLTADACFSHIGTDAGKEQPKVFGFRCQRARTPGVTS
jgi:hypothetical protein